MSKVKTGIIPSNVLYAPTTYATFTIIDHLTPLLRNQANSQGIRFLPACVQHNATFYLSILAVGYDALGNSLTNQIIIDTVPCPPECHLTGVAGNGNNDIIGISLADAQSSILDVQTKLNNQSFSSDFDWSEDLSVLFNLYGAFKMRVFFAWTPDKDDVHRQPAFIIQAANQAGDAIANIYLHDSTPGAGAL